MKLDLPIQTLLAECRRPSKAALTGCCKLILENPTHGLLQSGNRATDTNAGATRTRPESPFFKAY